jgi:hypothetical protein
MDEKSPQLAEVLNARHCGKPENRHTGLFYIEMERRKIATNSHL